ncbi:MAG: Holliday junction resolvase RuvX [bacterium]
MARVVGIDVGDRWLGIAVGDDQLRIATPRPEQQAKTPAAVIEAILGVVAAEQPVALIVGMPYTLRGEIGPQAEAVERVIVAVERRIAIPVHRIDERLTSRQAQQAPRESTRRGGKPREPQREDSIAAALILQSWLDRLPPSPDSVSNG